MNLKVDLASFDHTREVIIYVAFFTLTGVMMSLDVLAEIWGIALILFSVRLVAMIIGAYVGSTLAGDDKLHKQIGWMPYVTQAGVGLGLAIEVSTEYGTWKGICNLSYCSYCNESTCRTYYI